MVEVDIEIVEKGKYVVKITRSQQFPHNEVQNKITEEKEKVRPKEKSAQELLAEVYGAYAKCMANYPELREGE